MYSTPVHASITGIYSFLLLGMSLFTSWHKTKALLKCHFSLHDTCVPAPSLPLVLPRCWIHFLWHLIAHILQQVTYVIYVRLWRQRPAGKGTCLDTHMPSESGITYIFIEGERRGKGVNCVMYQSAGQPKPMFSVHMTNCVSQGKLKI